MRGTVTAVVGAQYGSEGKGIIVSELAQDYDVHVRTGGPNAGHTHYWNGLEFKQQSVPVGWINPDAAIVIGRGALVSREQLIAEVEEIRKHDPSIVDRLHVDEHALWLHEKFRKAEGGVKGELHKKIGSTGEGVGACRTSNMARDPENVVPRVRDMAHHWPSNLDWHINDVMGDTVSVINRRFSSGSHVLLEGTQGFGLSLTHGDWPYVTSHDTTATSLAADCGLAGRWVTSVILVARTYPIRVAGNSGPLEGELSWEQLSDILGREVEERTTVTKKVRRIGRWNERLFLRACQVNAPTEIAITFMDYLDPSNRGKEELSDLSKSFVSYVETMAKAPVSMICTGWNEDSKRMQLIR